jgi:hypothetical protein
VGEGGQVCEHQAGVIRADVPYATLARPMSALGQKRTSKHVRVMSALPPKADID